MILKHFRQRVFVSLKEEFMKFEKVVVLVSTLMMILALSSNSLAQSPAANNVKKPRATKPVISNKKSAKGTMSKKITAGAAKSTAKSNTKISNVKKSSTQKPAVTAQNTPIISKPLIQAIENSTPRYSPTTTAPEAQISASVAVPKKKSEKSFSAEVKLTLGTDTNVPKVTNGQSDTFFETAPTLNFKSGGWAANFGAKVRDYSNQELSNLYKGNEATASASFTGHFNPTFSSITTLTGNYNDERTTNDIGGVDENNIDNGMPSRYAEATFSQALGIDTNSVKSQIGGFFTYRNALSKETDDADPTLGERIFERDYIEYGAKGKITFVTASFLDISFSPSVTETKHKELVARLPGGQKAGSVNDMPLEHLIKSEITMDLAFKFLGSKIIPKALVGQVSDENLGARDRGYTGAGLSAELVLHERSQFTLTPNVMYKKSSYDNWTNGVLVGSTDKRADYETTGGIGASMMFTKNIGMGLDYTIAVLRTNIPDPTLNYRKETASTNLTITF